MTTYIELDEALRVIHRLGFYVKDAGLLGSALQRPRTMLFGEDAYESLQLKAAAMAHSLVKNHALVDGNKRTTWTLMVAFLAVNDFKHNFSADEGMEFILGLATDSIDLNQAAAEIAVHMIPWG